MTKELKVDLEAYQAERTKVREEGNKWIKEAPCDSKKAATSAIGSARTIGTYGIRRNFAEGELLKRIWLNKNIQKDYEPSLHRPEFQAFFESKGMREVKNVWQN